MPRQPLALQARLPESTGIRISPSYRAGDTSNYVAAAQCHLGFPYDAQYMQNTFMGGLWASKGYYPDNVLLQWNIANNADQITGYTISRRLVSTTNTSFQVVATLDPSVMSWQDQYCETGTLYEYKVTAAGIPGVQKLNLTYVTAIGFRQPIGTATGRITYAGTAVPDVSVLAQTNPAIPTSALGFDGVYGYMTIDETSHGSLTSQSGFTFQAWVKDTASSKTKLRFIFDKASVTRMWSDESKKSLVWVYGIDSVSLSFASVDSDYFHLSAVRNGNSLMIQLNDGKKVIQAKQTFNNFSTSDKAGTFYIAQQLNSYKQIFRFD